ncbi:MAG: hypothetical protein L6R40_002911 [Gallowayella cf. fulva]|nr:MAG: hypothetical protein L6R40_002911 [Xanthomendoza cf. fulva]
MRKWQSEDDEVGGYCQARNHEDQNFGIDTPGFDEWIPRAVEWFAGKDDEENVGNRKGNNKNADGQCQSVESAIGKYPAIQK